MPLDYGSQLIEHETVRTGAGLFDVSHMGQVRVSGDRAVELMDHLVPGDIGALADGHSRYTCLCNEAGGVVDDLIVTRLSSKELFVVVNAATREKDVAWMRDWAGRLGFGDVTISDESDQWAMIALQGPMALALAEQVLPGISWRTTAPFSFHALSPDLLVSRTGYTGETGIELLCRPDEAAGWWDRLVGAGARPAGLAARDSLRLEMGYPLYGQDLAEDISPVEGGIGWTVSLRKPHAFIGRGVVEAHKRGGAPRRRVGVVIDSRRPLRAGDEIAVGGRVVGVLTSGGFSPTLGRGIGIGIVEASMDGGTEKATIVSRGKELEVGIVRPPFVQVKSNG